MRGVLCVLLALGLQHVVAQSSNCPAATCLRPHSQGCYLYQTQDAFSCNSQEWTRHIETYPPNWYTLFNGTGSPLSATPPLEFIRTKKPCCRYCAWSLGYPLAVPQMMAISPKQTELGSQPECQFNTPAGSFNLCFLDCTKWTGDFGILDSNGDGMLNSTEFGPYFTDYFVAPAQNFKLYTGGGLSLNSDLSRIDPETVFFMADLDQDFLLSVSEWKVFRHFWSPALVSRTGPSKVPEDGRPLADGPLGGFFIDRFFQQVWQKNLVNILLGYYIFHSDDGFIMYDVREPVANERRAILRDMDIDGSERISIEEHYFRVFADQNQDGVLSQAEYYASLYRTTCSPLCPITGCQCPTCPADGTVAADCPALAAGVTSANALQDGTDVTRNFDLHDIDENGVISFLERKFVAADRNRDRKINEDEWRIGDFPEKYGPFEGHCQKTDLSCEIDIDRYNYYMFFHFCAQQGSLAHSTPISEYPWAPSCLLLVQVEESPPFIDVEPYTDTTQKAALEARGFLCWDADEHQPEGNWCYNGYAVKAFDNVAERLKWNYRLLLVGGDELSVSKLSPPEIREVGAGNGRFHLGLFTSYQLPWRPPQYKNDEFWCSDSLWKEDGLVVVKRVEEREVRIEWAIAAMIISPSFVNFVVFCYFVVLVMGHIFWYLERTDNSELFDSSFTKGVSDGLWFSMVTVTTVGYGDKVPITGIGKCLTILWMFFGILCFGVFSGSVSDQINTSAAENAIQGVDDLSTFRVGVLNYLAEPMVQGFNLGSDFNFKQVLCDSLADCQEKLLEDQTISAIIAPHSDVIQYFKENELHLRNCGNPLRIVGNNFTTDATQKWTKAAVKICSYSDSVYAARYLADAVSQTTQELLADGTADDLNAEYLTLEEVNLEADGCGDGSRYGVTLIIATVVVVVFYFCMIEFVRWYRKRMMDKKVKEHFITSVSEKPHLDPESIARKFGMRWLNAVRKRKQDRIEARKAQILSMGAHDHIMHMVKRLRNMYMQQAQEIRNIIHDTKTARERVSRLILFMSALGAVLVVILTSMTIAMMVIWGRLVRLTYL